MVAKLKIAVEDENRGFSPKNEIEVLFNPNQIQIQKSGWQISGVDKRVIPSQSPATLTVELFFDTSAPDPSDLSKWEKLQDAVVGPRIAVATDVRQYVNQIFSLTNPIGKLNRPPICQLLWGGEYQSLYFKASILFQGLLQEVNKTFTHFTAQGVPVRATLNCTFIEYEEPVMGAKKLNLIDDPIRVVKQGETLSSIAHEEYGDAALWRVIAEANRQIGNPRTLTVGMVLTVPPLPTSGGR